MHFATLLTASVLATVVSANPIIPLQNRDVSDADIAAITPDNNFGAPIPPWLPNSTPGWVITDDADLQNEYPDLTDSVSHAVLYTYQVSTYLTLRLRPVGLLYPRCGRHWLPMPKQ